MNKAPRPILMQDKDVQLIWYPLALIPLLFGIVIFQLMYIRRVETR